MGAKSESKYERVRKIGIGSYGVVFKCVNRQSGQVVAIKRYSENDSDPSIRKIALREVRMLRQLRHPNLITLIEVFRRKRRLHLVFDYCELTVLDVIERYAHNCPTNLIKKILWQLVNAVNYCHTHNCIHRDIKPENILINQLGVVKLCDFGFARNLSAPGASMSPVKRRHLEAEKENLAPKLGGNQSLAGRQALTEYVATRWYRAPELLIGEVYYDTKIDIWAIGCVAAELMRGTPLWPGKTDFDQLCLIKASLGPLSEEQRRTLLEQSIYDQANIERLLEEPAGEGEPLERKLPARNDQLALDFVIGCLQMEPARRPNTDELLKHAYIYSARMAQFMANNSSTNHHQVEQSTAASSASQASRRSVGRHQHRLSTVSSSSTLTGSLVSATRPEASTKSIAAPTSGVALFRGNRGSNSQALLAAANANSSLLARQHQAKKRLLAPETLSGSSANSSRAPAISSQPEQTKAAKTSSSSIPRAVTRLDARVVGASQQPLTTLRLLAPSIKLKDKRTNKRANLSGDSSARA